MFHETPLAWKERTKSFSPRSMSLCECERACTHVCEHWHGGVSIKRVGRRAGGQSGGKGASGGEEGERRGRQRSSSDRGERAAALVQCDLKSCTKAVCGPASAFPLYSRRILSPNTCPSAHTKTHSGYRSSTNTLRSPLAPRIELLPWGAIHSSTPHKHTHITQMSSLSPQCVSTTCGNSILAICTHASIGGSEIEVTHADARLSRVAVLVLRVMCVCMCVCARVVCVCVCVCVCKRRAQPGSS
jgi:hypothetical protein